MRAKLQAALLLGTAMVAIAPAHAALVISKGQTSGVSCSGGICNATSVDAVLNNKDLTNMLAAGDVKVFAEGVATDITVAAPVTWASSHTLTLGAYGSINVKDLITVQGTSGLTLTANVAQTGGVFRLVGTGKISFWDTQSALVINGTSYTLISNLPMLISAIASNPSGTFALSSDYDATQDGSYPHSPVPTAFSGAFEGLGNAINHLSIFNSNGGAEKIALFAQVAGNGQLSDVNVTNISMQVTSAYLAPLVANNGGTITHCSASGSIAGVAGGGNISVAGLVTDNNGTITRSHAAVTNSSPTVEAGGLVDSNYGTISLSDASGPVSASITAGGLAAYSQGAIADSSASGDVTVSWGAGALAGGLVGYLNTGSIERSFATGAVKGGAFDPGKGHLAARSRQPGQPGNALGGLVGASSGTIEYAYSTGSVSQGVVGGHAKHTTVGGLVGEMGQYFTSIRQAYALGAVATTKSKRVYLGGVIGADYSPSGTNDAAFWDLDTTGVENPNQGAGNIFDDQGLKGYPETNFRKAAMRKLDPSVWAQSPSINNGYPYLIANPPQQ